MSETEPPRIDETPESPAGEDSPASEARVARPRRRPGRDITAAFGALSLVVAASLFGLTQTRPGRDLVLSYLENTLRDAIDGEVAIGPVLRGNLLTRVVLEQFSITGADGTPFLALDTVRLEYDPLSLVRGQLRFRSLDAARAEIVLRQTADGSWNFGRIFGDTAAAAQDSLVGEAVASAGEAVATGEPVDAAEPQPEEPEDAAVGEAAEDGMRLIFGDVDIRTGRLEIRRPWTEGKEGRERAFALDAARTGETIWNLEQVGEESYEQVFALDSMSGSFPLIRVVDPGRPLRIEMRGLAGRLDAVRQPLEAGRFDGAVIFGDTVRIELDRLTLGSTELQGFGWVEGSPPSYEFGLTGDPVGFADLQWLPVPVPTEGGGPMTIALRSRADAMIVEIEGAETRSGDTRIDGDFTLALERTARFESLALELRPLRLQWLDRLLDRPERIDGYIRGRVTGAGRIDALRIDADVELADLDGAAAPSGLRASGGVALVWPQPLDELDLEFAAFEPRWTRILGLSTGLPGRVEGTATLDRPPGGALAFRGDIRYAGEDGEVSALAGEGALDLETGAVVNVSLVAEPLVLSVLQPLLPDTRLVGSVSGPIRASGGLSDLEASAELETPRGQLQFNGRFDLASEEPTYDVEIVADGVELDQWIEAAPASKLAVRGRVVGAGIDPASLEASFDLEILPSVFEEAQIDTSLVRFTVSNALAVIDTFAIRSDVGSVRGRGEFGLAEEAAGEVVLEATVPDLSRWNRWILDEIPGAALQEGAEDLFADLTPATIQETSRTEGLAGSLEAQGLASGNLDDFSIEAFLNADSVRYETLAAASLTAHVRSPDPLVRDSLYLDASGRGVDLSGHSFDSLVVRFERRGAGPADLAVHARRDSTAELSSRGEIEWGEGLLALSFDELGLRIGGAESSLQSPAHLAYGDEGLTVVGLRLAGALGGIDADGTIPDENLPPGGAPAPAGRVEPGRLDLRLDALDLSRLARVLPGSPEMGGSADAALTLTGTIGAPEMQADVHVHSPVFRTTQYDSLEARLTYAERVVRGDITLRDGVLPLAIARGEVRADLALRRVDRRLLDDPLDLEIRADSLPLELVLLPLESFEEVDGWVDGTITVEGEPGSLRYGGSAQVEGGSAWLPDLGVRYQSVGGGARFRGSEATIEAFRLASELGGTATVSGTVDFGSVSDPAFDLDLVLNRLHAVDRRDMTAALEGSGHLGGRYRSPVLEGRFRVRDGDIRQDEFLRERQVIDLGDPDIFSLIDTTGVAGRGQLSRFRNPFMRNLQMEVLLDLGPNLWLRSEVLGVEMVGEGLTVQIDRAAESVVMLGTVELTRGTYRFERLRPYSQQLRITGGRIQFVGNPDLNPNVDITAEYRTRTRLGPVLVRTHIGGTLRETELTLSSNPPMSDSDQVCFLAVGAPCTGSADRRLGERLLEESVLGTLSSGLSSALVGSTGLSYVNLRSVSGSPIGTPGAQGSQNLFDRTEVEFGWYAGEELFFAVAQPLGGGVPSAAMEWRFAENWTLEARAESRFDQQQFGLFRGTNIANDQTFALFLFREWSF
jgi:autotransporter translocation and assembly factor TamB